jgi:hypothetical protein
MWTSIWIASALAGEGNWDALTSGSGWKEVATRASDVGEVRVWHKEIDGTPCLLGVTNTEVKPDSLMAVVVDIPASTSWSSADLGVSETLYKGSSTLHFWQYINIPNWTLVADRFWVLEGRSSSVGEARRFRWSRLDATSTYPNVVSRARQRDASAVEPPINWGEWFFVPREGYTEVQYRACADVGGSIPQNVQQWIASRTLPDTVADVIREARRR